MMHFTPERARGYRGVHSPDQGWFDLVSFSFPVLASSGIDAKVGSLGLVEEMLPLRERQHVQGRLLI